MEPNLITLPQLLTYAPSLQSADPTVLQAYIGAASDAVRKFCNRNFWQTTLNERIYYGQPLMAKWYSGAPTLLYLKMYPVQSIQSVSLVAFYISSCNTNNSPNVLGSDDNVTNVPQQLIASNVPYVLDKANGMVQLLPSVNPTPWWYGTQPSQFVVDYTGGFEEIPQPVQLATSLLVKHQYTLGTQDMSMKSERIGDYSYERFGLQDGFMGLAIPPGTLIAQMLYPYQRKGVNGL